MTDEKEVVKENAEADPSGICVGPCGQSCGIGKLFQVCQLVPFHTRERTSRARAQSATSFCLGVGASAKIPEETVNEVAMETANFDQTLRAFMRRAPFRPFTVALMNGDRVEVDHATALVMRDGVAVYLGPGGVPVIFDHEGVTQFSGDLSGSGAED
jgi:hypothetical protein